MQKQEYPEMSEKETTLFRQAVTTVGGMWDALASRRGICVDCDKVTAIQGGRCSCGSESWLPLPMRRVQ